MEVSTLEELLTFVPAAYGPSFPADWDSQAASSPDLRATATLTVLPEDFPSPTDCPDCSTRLLLDANLAGAATIAGGGVRIESGVEFRMRFANPHDGSLAAQTTVRFERPCAGHCFASELRCSEDQACYEAGESFCLACEHRPGRECACVGSDGEPLPDDSACVYGLFLIGECKMGACVYQFMR